MDPDGVDVFPIENGYVIPASYVIVYQRVFLFNWVMFKAPAVKGFRGEKNR